MRWSGWARSPRLAQLSTQLEELPAGGDVLGVLGVMLVVLLVLELLGVTNVFTGI